MRLDTTALRTADASFPEIKSPMVTLIRIGDGSVTQAYRVADKKEMLRALSPDDALLAVWTGQYYSDVFDVPPDLVAQWKKALLTS